MRALLAFATLLLMGFAPWSPQQRGFLGGSYPSNLAYTGTCTTSADVTALPEGTWCELAGTEMINEVPDPVPCGPGATGACDPPAGGNQRVIEAYNSMVLDTTGNRVVIWGGGHNDYSGNEIYTLALDDFTFSRYWGPTSNANTPLDTSVNYETYLDGNPSARHTYAGLIFDATRNAMCTYGGSYWRNGSLSAGVGAWCFDFDTDTWAAQTNIPTNGSFNGHINPDDGKFYGHGTDNNIYAHTFASGADSYADTGANYTGTQRYYVTWTWYPAGEYFVIFGYGNAFKFTPVGASWAALTATGCDTIKAVLAPGAGYVPGLGKIVLYEGNDATRVWAYDPETDSCSEVAASGSNLITPVALPNIVNTGIFGHFLYVPTLGAFVYVSDVTEPFYAYKPAGAAMEVTTATIESAGTGTKEFRFGLAFGKGEVASGAHLSIDNSEVINQSLWDDGSVKFAIAAGTADLTGGVPLEVSVLNTPGASQTAMDASDIITFAPTASVVIDGDTATLDVTDTPSEIRLAGYEIISATYIEQVGTDPDLWAKFYVTCWRGGTCHVRATTTNGTMATIDGDGGFIEAAERTLTSAVVTIDGNTAFSGGLNMHSMGSFDADGWDGTDPATRAWQNPADVMADRFAPNYKERNPSETALNALTETYVQGGNGPFPAKLGTGGENCHWGRLNCVSAMYYSSLGDERAFNAIVAGARFAGSYPLMFVDTLTYRVIKPSDFPAYSVNGDAAGGANSWPSVGTLKQDLSHLGEFGYSAYLTTGDPYFYDIMLANVSNCYLGLGQAYGTGTSRLWGLAMRLRAWCMARTADLTVVAPASDAVAAEYITILATNAAAWVAITDQLPSGTGELGLWYSYNGGGGSTFPYPSESDALWMTDYFFGAAGYALDVEALAAPANLQDVFDFTAQAMVGRSGAGTGTDYCFTTVPYTYRFSDSNNVDPLAGIGWYSGSDSWDQVWDATLPAHGACDNTLTWDGENSFNYPCASETNQWGVYLQALAMAVDHGVAGAATNWARIWGATNADDLRENDCNGTVGSKADYPKWDIFPTGYDF